MLSIAPDEGFLQLTNNFNGTYNMMTYDNVSSISLGTDKNGNDGIRYTYTYFADDGLSVDKLHANLSTGYVNNGFVKLGSYGLMNFSNSDDETALPGHLNPASLITEAADVVLQTTTQMTIGFQKLGNSYGPTKSLILNGGKVLDGVELGLVVVNVAITANDAYNNGLKSHHIADIGIDGIIYGIAEISGPAGWIIGGGYFFANLIYEYNHNGRSLTEDLFDHD